MKYREWLQEWLSSYVKHRVKPKTYAVYQDVAQNRLTERFGHFELEEITPADVQRYVSELLQTGNRVTGGGLSSSSANIVIAVLRSSLKTAYEIGISRVYTMDRIKRPRPREKRVECFTVSEQRAIEEAVRVDKRSKMLGIVICLYTGMRIGELLALNWEDVDLNRKEIHITKTRCDLDRKKNRYGTVNAPKTDTSLRVIPIPDKLVGLLRTEYTERAANSLISHNGASVSVRSYQRSFELLLRRLSIPHRGFHALRHTFATRALECGMDVRTLADILGHKNPTVTLNRYAHSMNEHKRDMMNQVANVGLRSSNHILGENLQCNYTIS